MWEDLLETKFVEMTDKDRYTKEKEVFNPKVSEDEEETEYTIESLMTMIRAELVTIAKEKQQKQPRSKAQLAKAIIASK